MVFLNFYTECQTSMFIVFATVNTFNISESTRTRTTIIYSLIYLGTMCLCDFIMFINSLLRFIVWAIKRYKRHSRSSSKVDVIRTETQAARVGS